MIHVQHLLGIGHLQRALQLGEALLKRGLEVTLVSGGLPSRLSYPAELNFIQLPPLYSPDGHFTTLLDENGRAITDAWRTNRQQQLLSIFEQLSPHILLTETFPFGRRMLRFELLPLLDAAHSSPNCKLIISSIRDILQPKSKPDRENEVVDLINRYYDRILVHGDPRIARLGDSFGAAERIIDKIRYTGYIVKSAASDGKTPENQSVVVSAGGSHTGLNLLQTAIDARPRSTLAHLPWHLLVSHAIDEREFTELGTRASAGIIIERNRPDFPELLKHAALSISQAGYNTVTDLLASSTPAVLVPYAEADEREQTIRASRLAELKRAIMVHPGDLTPDSLARAVDQAIDHATAQAINHATQLKAGAEVNLGGAAWSADYIIRKITFSTEAGHDTCQ